MEDGHNAINFDGWKVYPTTGRPYRRWTFERDVPGVGASEGDSLHDRGPNMGGERLQVKDSDNNIVHSYSAEEVADPFFIGGVPDWNPPHGADLDIRDAIEDFIGAVEALAQVSRQNAAAVRKLMDGSGTKGADSGDSDSGSSGDEVRENEYLRIVREGSYSNTGRSFTHWELKVDVPTIPIEPQAGADGKPYLQAGDILIRMKDKLSPFTVERDEVEVASPELFQVRHLFAGLEGDEGSDGVVLADPDMRDLRAFVNIDGIRKKLIARATEDVPGTAIREGDFVWWSYHGQRFPEKCRQAIRGEITLVSRSDFESLATGHRALHTVVTGTAWKAYGVGDLHGYVSKDRVQNAKDDTSPIYVLWPWEKVSAPIQARSDAEAIFELLYQTSRPTEAS